MGAISDLWKSERGVVAIVSLALVTVVFHLGNISAEQWEALLKWIITGYTAGKTITGSVEVYTRSKVAEPMPVTPAPAGEAS